MVSERVGLKSKRRGGYVYTCSACSVSRDTCVTTLRPFPAERQNMSNICLLQKLFSLITRDLKDISVFILGPRRYFSSYNISSSE